MTNFKQVPRNKKRGRNRKDGHHPDRARTKAQRQATGDKWAAAGFQMLDWNKSTYTWSGNFPVFTIAPGNVWNQTGNVARCISADVEIIFEYGAPPADIAERLDDEILAIMRLQAEIAEMPLDWRPGEEIDIDAWMAA